MGDDQTAQVFDDNVKRTLRRTLTAFGLQKFALLTLIGQLIELLTSSGDPSTFEELKSAFARQYGHGIRSTTPDVWIEQWLTAYRQHGESLIEWLQAGAPEPPVAPHSTELTTDVRPGIVRQPPPGTWSSRRRSGWGR